MNNSDCIERQSAVAEITKLINESGKYTEYECGADDACYIINHLPAADVIPIPDGGIGKISDGYHTFNDLYYQRMILFAALVKVYKDKAWKSWKHEDGELCFGGGWFIVGIDTPQGSYTYHYEDKYWSWFQCEELPVGKHWDGHTDKDATRLLSLDVRHVVLCRECVHWEKYNNTAGCGYCRKVKFEYGADGYVFNPVREPNFYCADGEKRKEGDKR